MFAKEYSHFMRRCWWEKKVLKYIWFKQLKSYEISANEKNLNCELFTPVLLEDKGNKPWTEFKKDFYGESKFISPSSSSSFPLPSPRFSVFTNQTKPTHTQQTKPNPLTLNNPNQTHSHLTNQTKPTHTQQTKPLTLNKPNQTHSHSTNQITLTQQT